MSSGRLYYDNSYLRRFRARILENRPEERRVRLEATAFYPASGGQPQDAGSMNGIAVESVEEDDAGWIWHHTAEAIDSPEADCEIDWARRFDHMQQHSGQHLFSAVFLDLFGIQTVGFHLGPEVSTIDLQAGAITPDQLAAGEAKCAELVFENRPLRVVYEDAESARGLRKDTERKGLLRIVEIDGLDRSACGGTHVRATGEIGAVLAGRTEKIRGNTRIEFVAGMRALRRAQRDHASLASIAHSFSTRIEEAADSAIAQKARLVESEKARLRLELELAHLRGAQLYREATASQAGVKLHVERIAAGSLGEQVRAAARGFTASGKAVYCAIAYAPPAILVSVSAATGLDANALLQRALAEAGGRGGGSKTQAQGSLPNAGALESAIRGIERGIAATASGPE